MPDLITKTDDIVADFTRNILDLARKNGVDFDYVGNKGNRSTEIERTMDVNNKVVKGLLKPRGAKAPARRGKVF